MEPLINPMYLYLISIVGKIYTVFSTLAVVFGFSSIFIIFASCVSTHNIKEDLEMFRKKPLKYVFIAALTTGFVATVIPSEKTLIAMMAASCITPDNIVIAEDHIVELIEKIMAAVNKH